MNYIKALHIIFIVTWFSGLFYIVRLFIYNTEAGEKEPVEKDILRRQFTIMIKTQVQFARVFDPFANLRRKALPQHFENSLVRRGRKGLAGNTRKCPMNANAIRASRLGVKVRDRLRLAPIEQLIQLRA